MKRIGLLKSEILNENFKSNYFFYTGVKIIFACPAHSDEDNSPNDFLFEWEIVGTAERPVDCLITAGLVNDSPFLREVSRDYYFSPR